MLELEFLTDDQRLIDLATAYWSRSPDAKWTYKLTEIQQTFGFGHGQVPSTVASNCVARLSTVRCPECGLGKPVRSRADFEYARKTEHRRRSGSDASKDICRTCRDNRVRLELAARQAAVRAAEARLNAWVDALDDEPPTRRYASMSLREAFLLDGLLRYAGDAHRAEDLSAWSAGMPKLCDTEEDTRAVFKELYDANWLAPSPSTPLDAFSVSPSGEPTTDVLRVKWKLATDSDDGQPLSLLQYAQAIERDATAAELHPIWEWVCLCELRAHFAFCQRKWHWPRGWTDATQKSLLDLLTECSLGTAKTVIWKCFKNLAAELQRRDRHPAHVYNMMPGSFLTTFDYYQARGWKIEPWRPLSSALYSQHLFNRVMGGGAQFYDSGTGKGFLGRGGRPTLGGPMRPD